MLIILLGLELVLAYGPIGKLLGPTGVSFNLFVLTTWLLAWFTQPRLTYQWALMAGLALDVLAFRYFGFFTVELLLIAFLLFQLRSRLLDVSSGVHSMLALLIAALISGALESLIGGFELNRFVLGIILNLVIGILLYYLLAIRLRLFARWAGQRL